MGLDMYLSAGTYLHDFHNTPAGERASYRKVLAEVGVTSFQSLTSIPFVTVKLQIADWKNAYQVHQWLIDRAQNGEDLRLVGMEVYREDLQELVHVCKRLLIKRDREEAAAALPPPENLWRTEEDWRDYYDGGEGRYWAELELTVRQLEPALDNPEFAEWEFFYLAS